MINPNRFTTIKVKDLTLANLYDRVLVDGHAGQLIGWSTDGQYRELLLGPSENPRKVIVGDDADIQILDDETMRSPVAHWGV